MFWMLDVAGQAAGQFGGSKAAAACELARSAAEVMFGNAQCVLMVSI